VTTVSGLGSIRCAYLTVGEMEVRAQEALGEEMEIREMPAMDLA